MEARCLHNALSMAGNALYASTLSSNENSPLRPNDRATESLATWLWLWEVNDGAKWARELGDAWVLPLLDRLLTRHVGRTSKVWTLDMELAHEGPDRAPLSELVARYREKAKTVWPTAGLDLGHLPALLLLEARVSPRPAPMGSHLGPRVSATSEALEEDPLWVMVRVNDQVLLAWWLDDPAFTPEVINSYRLGALAKDVVSHQIDDPAWVAMWLRHGASPAGAPELLPSERPLFRASAPVAQLLLEAGEDPDSLDEDGRLPDEMRRNYSGRMVLDVHAVFQARRQAFGRSESIAEAHARHQFVKWAHPSYLSPTPLDPAFQNAVRRGPLPRWRSGDRDWGLAEWLVRNTREQYDNMAAPLLDLARRQSRLRASLDQVGSSQVPDWAVAHVLIAGVDYKFKAKPGEPTRLATTLLPPPSPEVLSHLLRAWVLHGPQAAVRDSLISKAWPWTTEWAAVLTPAHAPAVHALVQSCLPDQGAPSDRWSLQAVNHLASATWALAQDPVQQLDLWAVTVLSPPPGPRSETPAFSQWCQAADQAPAEGWVCLPQTRAWAVLQPALERNAIFWNEVQAKVRAAQAHQVPPAPPSPRRSRARA